MLTTIAFFTVLFAVSWLIERVAAEVRQYLNSVSESHHAYAREDAVAEAKALNTSTGELWSIRRVSRFNSRRYYVFMVR